MEALNEEDKMKRKIKIFLTSLAFVTLLGCSPKTPPTIEGVAKFSYKESKLGFAAADMNHDGKPDYLTVDGWGDIYLHINTGKGYKRLEKPILKGTWPKTKLGIAATDINNDGEPDILGMDRNGKVSAYINKGDWIDPK